MCLVTHLNIVKNALSEEYKIISESLKSRSKDNEFEEIIESLQIYEFYGAIICNEKNISKKLEDLKGKQGIYFFVTDEEIKIDDISKINNINNSAKLHRSNCNVKPGGNSTTLLKENFIYIGITEDLQERLKQHIIESSDGTYSMKLHDPNRRIILNKAKVFVFKLKYDNYVKEINPVIERMFHNNHKYSFGRKS